MHGRTPRAVLSVIEYMQNVRQGGEAGVGSVRHIIVAISPTNSLLLSSSSGFPKVMGGMGWCANLAAWWP